MPSGASKCIRSMRIIVRYSEQDIDADDMALGRDVRQVVVEASGPRLQSEANRAGICLSNGVFTWTWKNASVVGPSASRGSARLVASRVRSWFEPACWSTDIEILATKDSCLPSGRTKIRFWATSLRIATEQRKSSKTVNVKPIVDVETPGSSVWQASLNGPGSATLEKATLLGVDLLRGHQVDLVAPTRRFGGSEK